AAMVLLVGRQVLFVVPLIYVLPLWFGLNGVWMAQPIANVISFLLISFWTTRELRRMGRE
ncbi:MAG: MATE family efflux transporter, partial [Deltaproteobacteria bacterium]|nr:MATE family efflux transporter [Deltaproteobacteria bacterium]